MKTAFAEKTRGEVLRLALGTPRDQQEMQCIRQNPNATPLKFHFLGGGMWEGAVITLCENLHRGGGNC